MENSGEHGILETKQRKCFKEKVISFKQVVL